MGRTLCVLAALLLAVVTFSTASARAGRDSVDADDLTVLRAHNSDAHLLALWRLGQPKAAAELVAEQAEVLYAALREDEDWRVRWLAAEALAQARGTYAPPADVDPSAFYHPPRFLDYSLNRWLTDDSVYVREAAARGVAAEQPGNRYKVSSEMIRALGNESELVGELVTGHVARIIAANPDVVHSLLWEYRQADSYPYDEAEDYLESQGRMGLPEAEAGRALLEEYAGRLGSRQYRIRQAFKLAGAAAMPALLELWEEDPRLENELLEVWTTMGHSAADAGPLLAEVLADQQSPLWWQARRAAYWIVPPNREQLALLMLPRVCCEEPSWLVIDTLEQLAPLPDSIAQPVIDQIGVASGRDRQDLINLLGTIGLRSELVFGLLTGLVEDVDTPEDAGGTALRTLAGMARAGSVDAARFVLRATAEDEERRGSVLHTMLWGDELASQPAVVAALADEVGAVELALRQPELLALAELNESVRQEAVAEITDPTASPPRIIRLASLLPLLDTPPPPALEEALWAQFEYAGPSSGAGNDYVTALAMLFPERARAQYLEICDGEEYRDRVFAGKLLDGLGAEAGPLLDTLAGQLVGAQAAEKLGQFFSAESEWDRGEGLSANVDQDFDLSRRRKLALAIEACGTAAAPYARQLLWALKRAWFERASATIPVSALAKPERDLEYALTRSHRQYDSLIDALVDALVAAGPAAQPDVLAAASGRFNDGAVWYGSTAEYRNPEYDRRLRIAALGILGEISRGDAAAARLLVERCAGEPWWGGGSWGSYTRDELGIERLRTAVLALGRLGVASDEVVMALLGAARDEDAEVRAGAVASLRQLAGWEYSLGEE